MIISHEKKFIFVKTRKTASTSVEIALSKFCGPDDVLTRISRSDEEMRKNLGFRGAQNFERGWLDMGPVEFAKTALRGRRPTHFYNHIPAWKIREMVGSKIWNEYFCFSIVRNPWDQAVSMYYYLLKEQGVEGSFSEVLDNKKDFMSGNWSVYTDKQGHIIVDDLARYEDLDEGLRRIGTRIGLQEDLAELVRGIKTKSDIRPKGAKGSIQSLIGKKEADLIGRRCRREIAHFGYAFQPKVATSAA